MNTVNFPRNLERKRKEAKERQAMWSTLSDKQKLAVLAKRPGKSEKQIAKIQRTADLVK